MVHEELWDFPPTHAVQTLHTTWPTWSWYRLSAVHAVHVEEVVAPTVSLAVPGAQSLQPCCFVVAPAVTLRP